LIRVAALPVLVKEESGKKECSSSREGWEEHDHRGAGLRREKFMRIAMDAVAKPVPAVAKCDGTHDLAHR